ncbi:MAG: hypothetical protein V1899_02520 [Planctomycetota bacterium]
MAARDGQDKCLGMLATTWIDPVLLLGAFSEEEAERQKFPEEARLIAESFKLCVKKAKEMKSVQHGIII